MGVRCHSYVVWMLFGDSIPICPFIFKMLFCGLFSLEKKKYGSSTAACSYTELLGSIKATGSWMIDS